MSNKTPQVFKKSFDDIYDLLEKAVEVCPPALWMRKAGGFYYWQQLVHVFGLIDAFVLEPDAPPTQTRYGLDILRLLKEGGPAPQKKEVLTLAKTMRTTADAYFSRMTDDALFTRNESRSQRKKREVSQLEAMITLVGHGHFHVGACDALLRENGAAGLM